MQNEVAEIDVASTTGGLKLARKNSGPAPLKQKKHSNRIFWLQMSPALLILLLMTIAPAIFLITKSLTNDSLLNSTSDFVGLQNYQAILTDTSLLHSARVTAIFVVLAVLIEMVFGLFLAQFLYQKSRANSVAGALLIIPFAVAPAVAAAASTSAASSMRPSWRITATIRSSISRMNSKSFGSSSATI